MIWTPFSPSKSWGFEQSPTSSATRGKKRSEQGLRGKSRDLSESEEGMRKTSMWFLTSSRNSPIQAISSGVILMPPMITRAVMLSDSGQLFMTMCFTLEQSSFEGQEQTSSFFWEQDGRGDRLLWGATEGKKISFATNLLTLLRNRPTIVRQTPDGRLWSVRGFQAGMFRDVCSVRWNFIFPVLSSSSSSSSLLTKEEFPSYFCQKSFSKALIRLASSLLTMPLMQQVSLSSTTCAIASTFLPSSRRGPSRSSLEMQMCLNSRAVGQVGWAHGMGGAARSPVCRGWRERAER